MNYIAKRSTRQRQSLRQVKAKGRLPAPWTRSTRSKPCPICCGVDCLLSAPTDPAATVCISTESPERIGTTGFLHVLRDGPPWAPWRMTLDRLRKGTA